MNSLQTLFITSFMLTTATADAIVIRHDVPDEKYNAQIEDFPALATFYKMGAHGTLVAPQWVATAAHAIFCLEPGAQIKVGNQWAEVEGHYAHPNYELGEDNDIALIKLVHPVRDITPATPYPNNDELGQVSWFIGLGGTGNGNTGQSISSIDNKGKLRKAQNKIIDVDDGDIIFEFEKGDDGEILEGVSGNGDSGGPAYIKKDGRYYLLGVSSRADSLFKDVGEYGVKEVYTRVSSYNRWIKDVINAEPQQLSEITTQNRFLQDNMKSNITKICKKVGLEGPELKP